MTIAEIGALLKTQDNRITADPIFIVQERHRVYGMDSDYADDYHYEWLDVDSGDRIPATPEQSIKLDRRRAGDLPTRVYCDNVGESLLFERVWYTDIWINVQPFFTEAAAQTWIKCNQHNYERPLRVYAESAYNNPEWKAIRKWLMLKARSESDYKRRLAENKRARQEAQDRGMMYCTICRHVKAPNEMTTNRCHCKQCHASRVNKFLHASGKLKSYRPARRKYPMEAAQ